MNMKKLREIIKQEIEKLEAEYTNIPEKDILVRCEIESWIDALEYVLSLINPPLHFQATSTDNASIMGE